MMWLAIGGLLRVGSLLGFAYVAFGTFFRVHARALEEQAKREYIPSRKPKKKKSVSVGTR